MGQFKKACVATLLMAAFAMPVQAQTFNGSDRSALSGLYAGSIILAPIWLPFMLASEGSEKVGHASDARKADQEKREKEAVKLKVRNKKGETETLYLPKETYTQINVKDGDRVDLENDANGVMLLKDGQPTYYFILDDKAEVLLRQQPLKTK